MAHEQCKIPIQIFARSTDILKVSTLGSFVVDKILVQLGKIVFSYDTRGKSEALSPLPLSTSRNTTPAQAITEHFIVCYPRPESFSATLTAAPLAHVGRFRGIQVEIYTGSNDVLAGSFSLRSSSAGMRLRMTDAVLDESGSFFHNKKKPGMMEFLELPQNSRMSVAVPFDSDQNIGIAIVHFEAHYTTRQGDYVFDRTSSINIELLIDVNVQDIFKEKAILSKFLFRPTRSEPIELKSVSLKGSKSLKVGKANEPLSNKLIMSGKPALMSYLVSFTNSHESSGATGQSPHYFLTLSVEYYLPADQIVTRITTAFIRDLENTDFWPFLHILIQSLTENARKSISFPQEPTETGTGFQLPSYDQLELARMTALIPPSHGGAFDRWSKEWYNVRYLLFPHDRRNWTDLP